MQVVVRRLYIFSSSGCVYSKRAVELADAVRRQNSKLVIHAVELIPIKKIRSFREHPIAMATVAQGSQECTTMPAICMEMEGGVPRFLGGFREFQNFARQIAGAAGPRNIGNAPRPATTVPSTADKPHHQATPPSHTDKPHRQATPTSHTDTKKCHQGTNHANLQEIGHCGWLKLALAVVGLLLSWLVLVVGCNARVFMTTRC